MKNKRRKTSKKLGPLLKSLKLSHPRGSHHPPVLTVSWLRSSRLFMPNFTRNPKATLVQVTLIINGIAAFDNQGDLYQAVQFNSNGSSLTSQLEPPCGIYIGLITDVFLGGLQ